MGKFTALDDPVVDQLVAGHMSRIVSAITGRMRPYSIVLRGSFGRGEGSVMLKDGAVQFLSDYEIDVATFSPFHRSLFAELTHSLSTEFCMQTGIRWTRPDCLVRDRIGPVPLGSVTPSISLYEFRYGSRILYGEDFLSSGPAIDPACIPLRSAVQLLLNRMAESLYYMPSAERPAQDPLEPYHWINKTVLACAESLLVLWKQYHYSYTERGRRFGTISLKRLAFMPERAAQLLQLVERATEFKLRPRPALYPADVRQAWLEIIPVCGAVLRHLLQQAWQISFVDYAALPEKFLRRRAAGSPPRSAASFALQKSYELYRATRARSLPRSLWSPFHASDVVYSVVPLLFLSYGDPQQAAMLEASRPWLSLLGSLQPPCSDPEVEWGYLSRRVTSGWKTFCY